MQTKKKILSSMVLIACGGLSTPTYATLPTNTILNFTAGVVGTGADYGKVLSGSYFGMDESGDSIIKARERHAISKNDGLFIGKSQAASGTHEGIPNGTESPGIDNPWNFFGNTGLHQTLTDAIILSDDGAGNVTLDLSGWSVTWNGIPNIPMNSNAWESGFTNGVAKILCANDCSDGDTYTLDYSATVPLDTPEITTGFGGVKYHLHLEGTIFVPNTPPTAVADTILVNEGESATINVTSNGSDDPDGDNTLLKVGTFPSLPNNGTVSGEATDTITYTNTITAASSDSFTYTVDDGQTEFNISTPETVTVTINHFPVANNDGVIEVEPSIAEEILILNNDTDADGNATIDVTSVTIITPPANGTAIPNATTGAVTYTNDGTTGPDSFTYNISDDNGAQSISDATVDIDVVVDPAPTCNGATLELTQDTSTIFDVSANATAGGSKTLNLSTVATPTLPTNGTLAIDGTTGVITYTPNAGYFGPDLFTYTVADSSKTCTEGSVDISVLSSNTAPVAVDDNEITTTTTAVNTALNIDVKANDTDDDDLANSTVTITNQPLNGSANVETDGTVTYTPATGYSGAASFTYNLTDAGGLQSLNATVSATVAGNDPSVSSGVLTPGDTAVAAGSTDARVMATEIGVTDNGSSEQQGISQSCIGSCFDFEVTGFSGDVQVVLPLSIAIPTPTAGSSLLYRKLTSTGWVNFDTSGNNAIHTAPGIGSGASTVCPPAGDANYSTSPGLTTGDRCIRLTIVDNGPNDNDATVGTVADPGGIAESFNIDTRVSSTDGCSMSGTTVDSSQRADWWLVAGFMGLLGLLRLKRNKA